jgi:hypothetical protein
MSETPDATAEDFEGNDNELPSSLPLEAPEADAIEQARGVREDPEVVGGPSVPRPDSAIDEADEADRQEQAEVVSYDENEETR